MKKGTKAILIVAAVMILTGSIMSIICLALGARWQDTGAYWYGFFGWGMGNYSEGRLEAAPEAGRGDPQPRSVGRRRGDGR